MKKFLFLTLTFTAIVSATTIAQTAGGPSAQADTKQTATAAQTASPDKATMLEQMKNIFKSPMMEKTGLTEAQVDRVIEINLETRLAAASLRDLPEADRSAKIAELKANKEKQFAALLTAEQIQAVKTFYEDMGKNMQKAGN